MTNKKTIKGKREVDKGTFGSSRAEIALANAFNRPENFAIKHYMGKLINEAARLSKSLSVLEKKHKSLLYKLLRKEFLGRVDNSKIDSSLGTVVKTCLVTLLRRNLLKDK